MVGDPLKKTSPPGKANLNAWLHNMRLSRESQDVARLLLWKWKTPADARGLWTLRTFGWGASSCGWSGWFPQPTYDRVIPWVGVVDPHPLVWGALTLKVINLLEDQRGEIFAELLWWIAFEQYLNLDKLTLLVVVKRSNSLAERKIMEETQVTILVGSSNEFVVEGSGGRLCCEDEPAQTDKGGRRQQHDDKPTQKAHIHDRLLAPFGWSNAGFEELLHYINYILKNTLCQLLDMGCFFRSIYMSGERIISPDLALK